ncbi:hypothetical protein [Saccharopolyspora phatthalungensis]|uniref:Uncharacterized protein n=1 Tax=Saccharopolyspora phatthalungensis TaxID=664693 RepID=A0A840Q1R5_9PSEU|nr:hypothetical protein [Saccharopolyspora phatthalungensis]MBB5154334.1 hypothetical protein [Saccharopolyspora phatthalungensis]
MDVLDFSSQSAELLPQREALGGCCNLFPDINTIVAVNTAVALFGSQATAAQVINQF